MGKAKRRKHIQELLDTDYKKITVFSLAKSLFARHGRGMIVYPGSLDMSALNSPCYLMASNSNAGITDKLLINAYDPSKQLVLSLPLINGNWNAPFITSIYHEADQQAKLSVLVPKSENDGFFDLQVFR